MTGGRRGFDPDEAIRSLAQRVVDRFELDPRDASRAIMRTGGIGFVGGVLVLAWIAAALLPEAGEPSWKAWILAISPLLAFGTQVLQISQPPVRLMSPMAGAQRLIWVFMALMMTVMVVLMPARAPLVVKLSLFAVTLGWTGGIAAVYVHMCRKPPRRPRREAAVKRLAKA